MSNVISDQHETAFSESAYDALWNKVDAFMLRVKPCAIKNNTCLNHRLGNNDNFCCAGCEHLGIKGCEADKPLTCRVWLCQVATNNLSESEREEYFKLYDEVFASGFFSHRSSKNEVIEHLT
jgi:hypothetical protein